MGYDNHSIYYVYYANVYLVSQCSNIFNLAFQMTDLAFFLAILLVAILAYGVASQALRFPNDTVEWKLLKDVVYLPYWQMYGELFLDEVVGKYHTEVNSWRQCSTLSCDYYER